MGLLRPWTLLLQAANESAILTLNMNAEASASDGTDKDESKVDEIEVRSSGVVRWAQLQERKQCIGKTFLHLFFFF